MAIAIELHGILAELAGTHSLTTEAASPTTAIADLARRFPALAPHLCDARGRPPSFVRVYLNGADVAMPDETPLRSGDALVVIAAVAGG